ncbi:hypothetical protein QBC36DRAFT_83363 [Triangularia setosa]|uniref:Zn(2)-C6 fungal-type domain-containing protein n=1 Tax=Triangularia setosa TaxID=2587417 RepID=A0AAN6WGH9_9PEZI|nr:hypothetical protein QBC36DRAFT_83363 [Podospora setosa]
MAGPGGGPPRRSHTKSRKGCDSCKRRHIRCDESFPQCRNCTKHKVRCPYNDITQADERSCSPDKPDLMWNPQIEEEINQWKDTGVFPFPNIYPAPAPYDLTVEQLRLIHHVASISDQMDRLDANGFTLWTRRIPTIIQIGATYDYVLHALLAFSATHLAHLTDCPLVGNMAYEHRGIALNRLQEAIGCFSRENSDAILAASLVLSWQATDWKSWTQLMQGTSTIIDAMESWKHESLFGDFIAESSTFPTGPPSPTPEHQPSQPCEADLESFQRTLKQLQKLETHLKHSHEPTKPITQLIAFMKGSRKIVLTQPLHQQFERLRSLRTWLFWLPVEMLQQGRGSANSLVVIAHYYTAALLMERLFPDIGAAYFGSLAVKPIEEIHRRLETIPQSSSERGQTPISFMDHPLNTVYEFRARMGWAHPVDAPTFQQYPGPYFLSDGSPAMVPAASPEYFYGDNVAFSYSTEDLSVPNSAVSPLQLSSPFPHSGNQQYLGIPSPYGAYSPVSSVYGGDFGDAAHSDIEDSGNWTVPYSAASPVMGPASHRYSVGFVSSPIQSTWA